MAGLIMNRNLFLILMLRNPLTGKHSSPSDVSFLFLPCSFITIDMTDKRVLRLLHVLCSDTLRNEDMDGEWEAPHISNPACRIGCGEWSPPMIDNPKYKGIWRPPMIDNPNYQVITTYSHPTVNFLKFCADFCYTASY